MVRLCKKRMTPQLISTVSYLSKREYKKLSVLDCDSVNSTADPATIEWREEAYARRMHFLLKMQKIWRKSSWGTLLDGAEGAR